MECNSYFLPHDNKIIIGMIGPPSSGKDTLCDYLSMVLSNSNKKMTEVARDYMEKNGTLYSPFQERIIFEKVKEREQEVFSTYQVTLSPGAKFLTYFYAVLLSDAKPNQAQIDNLIDMYGLFLKSIQDYDYLFFCESLNYDRDGLRYQKDNEIILLQNTMINFLDLHKVNYIYLKNMSLDQRAEIVLETIGAQKKEGETKNGK